MTKIEYTTYPNGYTAHRQYIDGVLVTGVGRTKKEAYKNMKLAEKRAERYLKREGLLSRVS